MASPINLAEKEKAIAAANTAVRDLYSACTMIAVAYSHFQSGGYLDTARQCREEMCAIYNEIKEFENFVKKLDIGAV
jgi:hypothetical protein